MIKKLLLLSTALLMAGGCIFLPSLDVEKKWTEQFVAGDESSPDKILLLPVQGMIMTQEASSFLSSKNACTPDKIQELLKLANDDRHIKAVIMVINSPGGGVTASDIIHRTIREFKQKNPDKPIIALMQDTAASGGYYIACSADYVMAHPTTITGSIGVISMFFALEDLMGKIGVEAVIVKSGKAKDSGSPFRKMTAEEKEYMQKIIDEMYNRFLDIVAEARKNVLTRDEIKTVADGRVLTGEEAKKVKLVDETGYLTNAYAKTLELARLKSAKVIRYQKSTGLFDNMFMGPTPSLELTYLAELVLKTNTSQFMYLWMPEMAGK